MNYDFERWVHEVVSTCHEANYDYDEVYDMVCDAVDDSGCSIDDVDGVRVKLLMSGDADGANLLGAIITDMYIDRVIVPRIHAILDAKQMAPEAIAQEIYSMLCRYASSANYVILTVLAELRWDDSPQRCLKSLPHQNPSLQGTY